ncbi:uncharacterized protein J4E92_001600 [Alternaria infectoria]|uniref:uncharacterized protein n=1 Tax=Alternaria infectoria TaxID=45303 RepID=UPI00221F097D|nr:uncharacterized protein J4E92_001600 [Alternaria infectoria]KAI4936875.1 hypothetical protein J4E92_001600 [Alternaria infectoria]
MAYPTPNIDKALAECWKKPEDYHAGEDPSGYTFCDTSRRMLVAKNSVTGDEVWMGVFINRLPHTNDFKLKPSLFSSGTPGPDSAPIEMVEVDIKDLITGIPRAEWWQASALNFYKRHYRDWLRKELVEKKKKSLDAKKALPAKTTTAQPKDPNSIKKSKGADGQPAKRRKTTEGQPSKRQNSEVKTIDTQRMFFDLERILSASEYKLIGAQMAETLNLKSTPPTRVLSEMRDFARDTGFSVCYAPSWGQWLEDTRQELPEPVAVDANTANKEEDKAGEPMDPVSIADSIADMPSNFRLRLLDPMPDDMIAAIEKVTAYFDMRAKQLAARA